MSLQKINVYGASGHAKVILDIITARKDLEVGYVFDDNPDIKTLLAYKVYSPSDTKKLNEYPICFAIGDNTIRKNLVKKYALSISDALVHPSAVISSTAIIKPGSVVMANCVVNASTQIGKHCIINTAAVVEHDVVLDDFVHISPNAAITGGIQIKEGTHIGANAVVLPNILIGIWVTVGAGAVVTKDVGDHSVVMGNPAKPLKT